MGEGADPRFEALEQDLRASRDALTLALRAGRMGTWSWDGITDRIVWDEMLCALFEVAEAPTTFAGWLELVHPDDRALATESVERALATGQGYELVHRITRADGSVRYVEGRADVIVDAAGAVVGVRGVTVEVTEREVAHHTALQLAANVALLADAGVKLAATLEPEGVLQQLAALVVPALADGCEVAIVQPGHTIRRMVYAPDVSAERVRRRELTPIALDTPHPIAEVLRTGRPLRIDVTDDREQWKFGPPDVDTTARSLGLREAVIVPLTVRGDVIGAVGLGLGPSGRRVDDNLEQVAVDLATRAALCYDNALLYAQQRTIADTLQRSLLPAALPEVGWIELAGRYFVPGSGVEVGGDFYDVIDADQSAVLIIGDVCGKGVEAAGLTALARHTLRTALAHTADLVVALRWLHDAVLAQAPRSYVTAALVRLTPVASGTHGEAVVGGHPRPVVLRSSGATELVESGGSAPGLPTWHEPELVAFELAPDDAVVLYTDGVTDVPGDAAISTEQLQGLLATYAGGTADAIATALSDELERIRPSRYRSDDIAMLIARVAR